VRLSVNWVVNAFPGSAPVKASQPGGPAQTPAQRAISPANTLPAGVNDAARDSTHVHHELLARVGIAL
jgi:hypothetical protein